MPADFMTAGGAPGTPVFAQESEDGLVNILQNMFSTAQGLIVMGIILVAMAFVIMTWMRTRSLVPTLGAMLLGALVAWGVNGFSWFANRIGSDVEQFQESEADGDTGIERPGENQRSDDD